MILVALGVEETPKNVIDYGAGLIQVTDSTGFDVVVVEAKNGMIGCAQVVGGGGLVAASPHFPPPPPLASMKLVVSGHLVVDANQTFLVGPNSVAIPILPWKTKSGPTQIIDVIPLLTPIQQKSGLSNVIYHLFNVTDANAGALTNKTLAIPVDPGKAFLLKPLVKSP